MSEVLKLLIPKIKWKLIMNPLKNKSDKGQFMAKLRILFSIIISLIKKSKLDQKKLVMHNQKEISKWNQQIKTNLLPLILTFKMFRILQRRIQLVKCRRKENTISFIINKTYLHLKNLLKSQANTSKMNTKSLTSKLKKMKLSYG